ncbi:MAG: hypothetical protein V9F03_13635 [Microthrixaceae bacterium]
MAFGQPGGPPAGQRQIEELTRLLGERGFDTFREARHRLGLTQRQANGRFTVDEANELIERLEAGVLVAESLTGESGRSPDNDRQQSGLSDSDVLDLEGPAGNALMERAAERRRQEYARAMLDIPDNALADELVRRGWCCIPPGE